MKNCIDSDLTLSTGIAPGSFRAYRCRNNLWDIATPIVAGEQHVGNLFLGQFFYEDEIPDYDFFRSVARQYDFDETGYLAALERVPRWRRDTVQTVMQFYARFTELISKSGYSNVKLARELTAHESTIQSLKKSEEKLRAIFNASPLAMVLLDREGRILDSNDVHAGRLGRTRDEILGRIVWELLPGEVVPHRKKHVAEVFETGIPFSGEDQRGRNWFQYHIHPVIRNETGKVESVIVEAADITDQKTAEIATVEALSWYREIFEGSKDAIFISDENARFVSVNTAACDLTGYRQDELTAMRIPDLHDEKDLDAFDRFHARIMKGDPIDSEARILRRDGTKVETEFNNKRITVLGRHYMHTTARDISERKRAEAALRSSENRHRSILKTAMDGFIMVDLQGHIREVNQAYCEISGYREKELLALTVADLEENESREEIARRMQQVQAEGYDRFESRHRRKDGRIVDVEISLMCLENKEDGLVCFVRDITERKRTEQALNQTRKMESIGSLAGGIAHDFNNILFPIVGLSEMMMDDFPAGSMEHQNIEEIYKAGTRGRELVRQILSFSRQSDFRMIPVHIQKILKEVFTLCRATIPADISLASEIQHDCRPVMADPTQIHQVAMNLITNAYHAVESTGGKITVQLREIDSGPQGDPGDPPAPGRYVVLTVSDTGTGIDPAVLGKIFDPYFTTKKTGRGTGLGLATVYGIVKAHKGEIRVHSEVGRGSLFHVYFPAREPVADEPAEHRHTPLATGTGHILLVDDEAAIVHLEKQMLERLGYRITGFTSSTEALAAVTADSLQFDLVITDMHMPHLNGMQLAEEIMAANPKLPVIICTGFSEHLNKEKALEKGIQGFLMKPVEMTSLAAKIQEVMARTR